MKTWICALVASAALTAAAAPAFAATGYVGASAEWGELDTPAGDADSDGVSINGAVAFDVSDSLGAYAGGRTLGVQLDGAYVAGDDDSDTIAGAAHLFARDQAWLWGGYVALADVEDTTVWGLGAEANRYFDQFTIAGSLGYSNVDDLNTDVIALAGEVRYFVTNNTRIDAGLGWANVDAEAGGEDDALTLAVGAEHQFADTPFSVFGGYSRAEFDDADTEVSSVSVGVRWNFAPSLMERDRAGPSLNRAPLNTALVL